MRYKKAGGKIFKGYSRSSPLGEVRTRIFLVLLEFCVCFDDSILKEMRLNIFMASHSVLVLRTKQECTDYHIKKCSTLN